MNDFEAPGRRLIACRYPTMEVAKSSWERLSHYFAARKAGAITTMRCVGSGDEGDSHIVVAAGFSDRDAVVLARAPWGEGATRCEEEIPELIAKRLYARAARNAAALASAGHRGTFTTRRPAAMGVRVDGSGVTTRSEQRPQG
jgi:hypothetical protein